MTEKLLQNRIYLVLFLTGSVTFLLPYYNNSIGDYSNVRSNRKTQNNLYSENFTTSSLLSKSCKPSRHIVFVKTHKTGSSTMLKLLRKYIEKNNLTEEPLINELHFLGGYPGRFDFRFLSKNFTKSTSLLKKSDNHINNLVNHFRYTSSIKKFMPKDTRYFSVIRNPWNQFVSTFYFFFQPQKCMGFMTSCNFYPFFNLSNGEPMSLLDYLHRVEYLDKSVPWYFRGKNNQAHDLGLDPFLENDTIIKNELNRLSNELDLVLITEYFDESFILLKDLLCMEWEDIVYEHKRANSIYHKNYTLAKNDHKLFKKIYKLDIALYSHFNKTLWKKVDAYGRKKMDHDVAILRKLLSKQKTPQKKTQNKLYGPEDPIVLNKKEKECYNKAQINFDIDSQRTILLKKILNHSKTLPKSNAEELVQYMLDNSGGCPA